tara:strand:+ start:3684 stop:3902 length:219 start_codon:yes stop_codon:yes gene_type:complete
MSEKTTKKELTKKIEDLEKELEHWKCRTQLARNYSIVVAENEELKKKIKKRKAYYIKLIEEEKAQEEDEESE